jgi:hypothetical protein
MNEGGRRTIMIVHREFVQEEKEALGKGAGAKQATWYTSLGVRLGGYYGHRTWVKKSSR